MDLSKLVKKGQLISTDLIISTFIFLVLVSFLFITIRTYQTRINDAINNQEMRLTAIQISELLIKTKGLPENWEDNPADVRSIGLVNSDRKIDNSKLDEFIKIDYDDIKDIFNINSFDFYFAVKNKNGEIFIIDEDKIEKGVKASLISKNVITIKRIGLYGNDEKTIEIMLWK